MPPGPHNFRVPPQPLPGTSNEDAWLDTKALYFQGLQDANPGTPPGPGGPTPQTLVLDAFW